MSEQPFTIPEANSPLPALHTGTELVRPVGSMLWELRAAWGTGRRVALSLDERCTPRRLEGWIKSVAATGAYVRLGGVHVPADAILAVHLPSLLGDSTATDGAWHGPALRPEQIPGQLEIREVA